MKKTRLFEYQSDKYKFRTYSNLEDSQSFRVNQQHTNIISNFDEINDEPSDGIRFPNDLKNAVAIKTADCLPVLFIGKRESVLLHAGWKGLQSNILLNNHIKEINPFEIIIGPSIQKESFEVTQEFILHMPYEEFYTYQNQKIYFDLQGFASKQINESYPDATLLISNICTFLDGNFHSYRRNKTNERNWHIWSQET